jgi:hypothetical protein
LAERAQFSFFNFHFSISNSLSWLVLFQFGAALKQRGLNERKETTASPRVEDAQIIPHNNAEGIGLAVRISWQKPMRILRVFLRAFASSRSPLTEADFLGLNLAWKGRTASSSDDVSGFTIAFPYWMLLAAAAYPKVIESARVARARRRVLRGLCPRCGYDCRGGSSACPECGLSI